MFVTNDALRTPLSSLFGQVGETNWPSIELALHHVWFVMSVLVVDRSEDEPWKYGRTFLLSNIEQAEQLMQSSTSDDFEIRTLNIVTPGHVNGTDDWVMESLARVWSAQEPNDTAQNVSLFETKSGHRYSDSLQGTPAEELIPGAIRFELPTFS